MPSVCATWGATMFDWAPASFGAGRYFAELTRSPHSHSAIETVDFAERVQVTKPMAIQHEIISSPDRRDTEQSKANRLIQAHPEIQNRQRDDERVNDR